LFVGGLLRTHTACILRNGKILEDWKETERKSRHDLIASSCGLNWDCAGTPSSLF
jgi:hypothetical protein